jgi:hypothetical protein
MLSNWFLVSIQFDVRILDSRFKRFYKSLDARRRGAMPEDVFNIRYGDRHRDAGNAAGEDFSALKKGCPRD